MTRIDTPIPDPVQSKLNDARASIVRIVKAVDEEQPRAGTVRTIALATADALLAIVVAVEGLAKEVRK